MKAVIVFAALLAVAAAYPQANWQWGQQTQAQGYPQQSGAKPEQPMQPNSPSKPESPSDEGSKDSDSESKGHDSWSKGNRSGVFNDVTATVGSAIVAVKGNVIYKIRYASQRTQDEEQRNQPNY